MRVPQRATVLFFVMTLGVGASRLASASGGWEDYMEGDSKKPPPVRAASDSGDSAEDWSSSSPLANDLTPAKRAKRTKVAKRGKAKSRAKAKTKRRAARVARRR